MPIIDQQRSLVEVGRLRMGEKVATDGGTRPAKLDKWRLTSRDRQRLEAAAAIYGGTVAEWGDEWELYTESNALDIAVVPGQALSQYMELWGQKHPKAHKGPNPVICLRRCDGQIDLKSDSPCICAAEDSEACKPTTRLSVALIRVAGVGVWRLDTKGRNAARELLGVVELLEILAASRRPVPARLRLDPRTSKTERGTFHFVVPVIDIDEGLDKVLASIGAADHFTPVPVGELPPAPASSIAAQLNAVEDDDQPQNRRAGAAEPIRSTGIEPSTDAERREAIPAIDTHNMNRRQLVDALGYAKLPTHGNLTEMRDRLQAHLDGA